MSEAGPERVTTAVNTKTTTAFKAVNKSLDVTLPAFASMLPVRTIGALYTLRSGALVRFELTRDTKGDGWFMKRGTILVGMTKGGDVDRAYVSLLGFIDPQTGKLVKLGGDLLGGDGGAGLKGKRRQINGGWIRAIERVGSAALDVTGALLSGRANDTVIISDGMRSRAINPVTDQLNAVLTNEREGRQGQSFVEVIAGTPGYVLVTDLPSTIKGTEPTPELNNDTLASLSDVDTTRSATGLTQREFADLLADGSPEEIRSAMPRMSPQMRKVAETVLRP
jgi:DNA-binding transcriptional regulator YiaG